MGYYIIEGVIALVLIVVPGLLPLHIVRILQRLRLVQQKSRLRRL